MNYQKEQRRKNRARISVEPWAGSWRWTAADIDSWIVCIDGQTIGRPVKGAESAAVLHWLAGALTDIELLVRRDLEDSGVYDEE